MPVSHGTPPPPPAKLGRRRADWLLHRLIDGDGVGVRLRHRGTTLCDSFLSTYFSSLTRTSYSLTSTCLNSWACCFLNILMLQAPVGSIMSSSHSPATSSNAIAIPRRKSKVHGAGGSPGGSFQKYGSYDSGSPSSAPSSSPNASGRRRESLMCESTRPLSCSGI